MLGAAELQGFCLPGNQEHDRPFKVDPRQGQVVLREDHDLVLEYWNFLLLFSLHQLSPQKITPASDHQERGLGSGCGFPYVGVRLALHLPLLVS